MVFPLMQLIVLGYAFGGKIKNGRVALVDKDHGTESRLVREHSNAITAGPQTFSVSEYQRSFRRHDGSARRVRQSRHVKFPPIFPRACCATENPRIAFIEDNTDNFTASGILERIQQMQTDLNGPPLPPLQPGQSPALQSGDLFSPQRLPSQIQIQTVEVYPYIEYIKYLLAGSSPSPSL